MRLKSVLYFIMHEKRYFCYKTKCRQLKLHTHVAKTVSELFKMLFEERLEVIFCKLSVFNVIVYCRIGIFA